jgi:hypothetical protein
MTKDKLALSITKMSHGGYLIELDVGMSAARTTWDEVTDFLASLWTEPMQPTASNGDLPNFLNKEISGG